MYHSNNRFPLLGKEQVIVAIKRYHLHERWNTSMASDTLRRKSSIPLLVIVCVIVLFIALPYLKLGTLAGVQTQSNDGQCLPKNQGFNERQEAFTLAQTAEQTRSATPTTANYGLASYTICYKDGSQSRVQSNVFSGQNNTNQFPKGAMHAETSRIYGTWLPDNKFT